MNKIKRINQNKVKSINDLTLFIKQYNLGDVYKKIPFSSLTTLRIGGSIELLYYPFNLYSLTKVLKIIRKNNINYFLIGNGSNVLANDNFFHGVVISLKYMDFKYELKGDYVRVSGGFSAARLIFSLMKDDVGGLEFLVGIPGTIGGIINMNAGAYGHTISDILEEVKVIDKDNNIRIIKKNDLNFSYRNSRIKEEEMIVIEALIRIEKKDKRDIKEEIKLYLDNRKDNQPLEFYNAGCTFKNKEVSSWKLIDEVGCRGYRIGDAGVSEKHANFLVNYGKASAFDMFRLIDYVVDKVKESKNIELECEWIFVNFDFEENVV